MAEGIQIETARTDSFSMEFFKFGNGKDTLVILPGLSVQGVMIFADAAADAYKVLADDYTIYVFDRRKELPASYSIFDMAHDTLEVLQALGLDKVSVMGASQGGMIAMVMAIEQPEMIQKLVLCSTAPCLNEAWFSASEKWLHLAKAGNAKDLYLAFGEAVYPTELFEQWEDLLAGAADSVTEEDMERFIILTEGMGDFDIRDDLKKITCPVFVVGAKDDRVLGSEAAGQIADNLGDKTPHRVYMYDGYGHAVYDTAPDYKDRMLEFLKSE